MKPFLTAFILALVGCASTTPQSDAFFETLNHLPPKKIIEGVPYIEQTSHQCGPATLTMALKWAGKDDVTVDEISDQVFTPGALGSFQTDMITAARRHGMMALPLHGISDLLQELAAGHPVIVFENLSVSWWPVWHYALIFGYDLKAQKVILHSGHEASKRWDIRVFERSWKLGDYWGLVVLPPTELGATAGEMEHMKAASALEQLGNLNAAETAYKSILIRWPESLSASVGLSNIAYSKKEFKKSADFLKRAIKDHPTSAILWYNLVFTYDSLQKTPLARTAASKALKYAPENLRGIYEKNLKKFLRIKK